MTTYRSVRLYRAGIFCGHFGANFDASGVARLDAYSRRILTAMQERPDLEALEQALFRASEVTLGWDTSVTRRVGEWEMEVSRPE